MKPQSASVSTALILAFLPRAGAADAGRLQTGRVVDYKNKPERQVCRLFLSMMAKMELRPKTFGDAAKPLEEV